MVEEIKIVGLSMITPIQWLRMPPDLLSEPF
jgi:hypothetical protein